MRHVDPNHCATCGRPFGPGETLYREPGWERDDYDCAACYASWPTRARAALDAKKEVPR